MHISRLKYLLAAVVIAAPLAFIIPAGADSTTTTLPAPPTTLPATLGTTTTGLGVTTTTALGTPSLATGGGYDSLAAAMVSYWAGESNETLSAWTQSNGAQMSSLLGSSATGSTLAQLTAELTDNGAALQLSSVDSMSGLLSSLESGSSTLDGQAATSGMNLADQLGSLYSSTAATPSADSALFGLFYDKTLTSAVTTSPTIFSSMSKSLTSPSAQADWSAALTKASAATSESLSSLPDPCAVGMLTAMGTGTSNNLGGSACSSCDTAGTYLNADMEKIFNPASNNLLTGDGGVSTDAWTQLQGWLQSGTEAQNPDLTTTTISASANVTDCGASSSATQGALSKTLPGVFSNLGG